MRLLLLAALSGEHILFIGPPGTAKSELGRRLSQLYKGVFFERLLTRFSVPEVSYQKSMILTLLLYHYDNCTNTPHWVAAAIWLSSAAGTLWAALHAGIGGRPVYPQD